MARRPRNNAAGTYYLLDMGSEKYGDSIVCDFGSTRILIDGGHARDFKGQPGFTSIPDQLKQILGEPPFKISLLVVTHCHADHIGCLPDLVKSGMLKPDVALVADENLGFGHGDGGGGEDSVLPDRIRQVVAALREEDRSDLPPDQLDQFLVDAARLEDRYKEMLQTLEDADTTVVRYRGVESAQDIVRKFAPVGMEILGPTPEHLKICADAIAAFTKDAIKRVADAFRVDVQKAPADVYRQLVSNAGRQSDAIDRPGKGAALNDQSIVIKFADSAGTVLLTGDMQFAKPEISGLGPSMKALRGIVAAKGPYNFVKLAHHSSYNGLDESVFRDFGEPKWLAHTGGRRDPDHPDHGSLSFLEGLQDSIQFARTDRNGLIKFDLKNGFTVSKGDLNDFSENTRSDTEVPEALGNAAPAAVIQPFVPTAAGAPQTIDLVFAKLPFETSRINLGGFVVEIDRPPRQGAQATIVTSQTPRVSGGSPAKEPPITRVAPATDMPKLGQGRQLPKLLFVTCSARLEPNIGRAECATAIKMIRDSGQTLVDVPAQTTDAVDRVIQELKKDQYRGVVIVGGFDVLPSQRVDVLTPDLRTRIGPDANTEPDRFMVWSDEGYCDIDGDGLPELPVTRIPDGRSAHLLIKCLGAGSPQAGGRYGLRNSQRPFADIVWRNVSGTEDMLRCSPAIAANVRSADVGRPSVYFMLHGSDSDGTRFWGEDDGGGVVEAIDIASVPASGVGIVFTGCCWGALTVDEIASQRTSSVSPRIPEQSMALKFLQAGALAFIGCTGAHYSPDEGAGYFGGPMHQAFWTHIVHGQKPPAEALFDAKRDYLRDMPHGRRKSFEIGVERKIYKQYSCLGLGW